MYQTSAMFRSLMARPSRTLTSRGVLTYPDNDTQNLTAKEIVSFVVTENVGEQLPLGSASAATLALRLDNRAGEWNPGGSILGAHELDGAVLSLEMGVAHPDYGGYTIIDGGAPGTVHTEIYDGGTTTSVYIEVLDGGAPSTHPSDYYWSKIGTYIIEDAVMQEQDAILNVKGADKLANKASVLFADNLTYPQTVGGIFAAACAQAGITPKSTTFINSGTSIPIKPAWSEKTSCRDVISYVACLACGFARIGRDGLLEIVQFEHTSDYATGPDRYIQIDKNGTVFGPFNALTVIPEGANKNAIRVAVDLDIEDTEQNSIGVQGNPLLTATSTTAISAMLAGLQGLTYDSARANWQGDPTVTTGDLMTITDKGGTALKVLVLKQELSYSVGFRMTSGNDVRGRTKGQAEAQRMRVFTPSGKLNGTAIEGDINIKAGENVNVLAGGNIKMAATNQLIFTGGSTLGDLIGNSGIKSHAGPSAPSSPSTGDLWFDTANFNVCKRWSGSAWVEYTQGKLGNSKLTIDGNGVAILSGGTFTVASNNFMIDSSGNVSMKGAITSSSGNIGGFTIAPGALSAQASGKPLLKLDTANSEIILGGLTLFYSGSSIYEFNVGTDKLGVTASTFYVGGGAYGFFDVMDGYVWCNGDVSAASFTDRTPSYTGKNAVAELKLVRNDKNGNIDHSTLPAFARKKINSKGKNGKEVKTDGRDIGAMISILTKAVQELDERIEKIENRTK